MRIKKYYIYSDSCKWDNIIGDFIPDDSFTGTYLGAHTYARKKYGKYYTLSELKALKEYNL
jgi:hypothetical protein